MVFYENLKLEDGSGARKLNPRFCGTFKIMEEVNDVSVLLNFSEPMKAKRIQDAFHVILLKPFNKDLYAREDEPRPQIIMDEGNEE